MLLCRDSPCIPGRLSWHISVYLGDTGAAALVHSKG